MFVLFRFLKEKENKLFQFKIKVLINYNVVMIYIL